MYRCDLAVILVTARLWLTTVNAGIPHMQTLDSVAILSDNDLAGNLTTRTTGALLLPPSTYSTAAQRCASLNEALRSPSHSDFSLGLNNALSYDAYLHSHYTLQYWISSTTSSDLCSAINTNGTVSHHSCNVTFPALCTNSAPILSGGESDIRPDLRVTVQSSGQNITGFRDFYAWQFRGIRFAPQPERFTFSRLYQEKGDIDATRYGPACLQGPDERWPEVSEDCLFLNVWTPLLRYDTSRSAESAKKKLKAVLVWLYGGGNTAGSGNDPEKEGGNVASRGDIVVVTFNYRLSNLGFLPFDDGVHNGNYAVSDMLTALRWVQKNIERFGGDPERVTVWGESAGATNVRTLLAIPEAESLIAGAIMQSMTGEFASQAVSTEWQRPREVYHKTTRKVLEESGCGDVADEMSCLRSYDALKWATEPGRTQAFAPVRDDTLIFTRALPVSGPLAHPHNIPILLGINRNEFSYQVTEPTTNFTSNLELLSAIVGIPLNHLANSSFSPETLPAWPTYTEAEKQAAVFNATSRISTSVLFSCLTHAFASSASKNNVFHPVFEFQFNRTYQSPRWTDFARAVCGRDVASPDTEEYYKCHAGEVPYTFGNILQQGWPDRDGLDTPFSRLIVDYWSAFARTGSMEGEEDFLDARGFMESKWKMEEAGEWLGNGTEVMRLQWSGAGLMSIDEDAVGCQELGLGKDFYDTYDYEDRLGGQL